MKYVSRVVDTELQRRLRFAGAVLIEGPKACGKTATARQMAASEVLLDVDPRARQALAIDPALVLQGKTPRLLDEWQIAPEIWNYVRRAVDDRSEPGQFILTGSAVPADDATRHTGAGRFSRLRMRPMSLFELGHSTATVSLEQLLAGEPPQSSEPELSIPDLAELTTTGGWPALQNSKASDAIAAVRAYLDEVCRVDVMRADGVRRDPEKVRRLLRSLARHSATYASASSLARDVNGTDEALSLSTVRQYLDALERLMIVENQPAWAPHLRSKSVLRSAEKRHFVDPSLAVAALDASPQRLLSDLNLFGFLFESLVVRDLRIYAQTNDARVLQYRDNTGLEADAIVETADGRWAAFEIKLGSGLVEEGAASLRKFVDRIDISKSGPPATLGVIVGSGYGYQRPDGVSVIPIGALAP